MSEGAMLCCNDLIAALLVFALQERSCKKQGQEEETASSMEQKRKKVGDAQSETISN